MGVMGYVRGVARAAGTLAAAAAGRQAKFGYHAIQDKGRRKAPKTRTYSEDRMLRSRKHEKLRATAQDQARNHTLLVWMIRRHLDYVSQFQPMARTPLRELNKEIEFLLKWHGRKQNFDLAKRHGRDDMMRIYEGMKVLDGDCAMAKIRGRRSGGEGSLQGIEGSRITKPKDLPNALRTQVNEQGLVLDDFGAVTRYCVATRKEGNMCYGQMMDADDVLYDGYFTRFDQTRGVSPLATALNENADLHEGCESARLNLKMQQLFAVAIFRELTEETDGIPTTEIEDNDNDKDGNQTADNRYEFDFTDGPIMADLDEGDRMEAIESKNPNNNFVPFTNLMIRMVLLALDIPYTAFDSMKASFSARIADRNEYEKSARAKRAKNQAILDAYTEWKFREWYDNPRRERFRRLCDEAGLTPEEAAMRVEWVATATPWMDKANELEGDAKQLAQGRTSRQRLCRRDGVNYFDVIDEQSEEIAYANDKGVPLMIGEPGQASTGQVKSDEEDANDSDSDAEGETEDLPELVTT